MPPAPSNKLLMFVEDVYRYANVPGRKSIAFPRDVFNPVISVKIASSRWGDTRVVGFLVGVTRGG